jgi:hypothetical protein
VGILGSVLAHALAGAGVRADLVERLLGPERATLDPAQVAPLAGALQGSMELVFRVGAAIACAAFVAVLAFPRVEIAPPCAREAAPAEAGEPGSREGEGAA